MTFEREDNTLYSLEYEPVLVSSGITNNIFGLHSELRLKEAKREHDAQTITFMPREGQNIKLKILLKKLQQVLHLYKLRKRP